MARAKRFDRDRAEARRRYRAALAASGAPSPEPPGDAGAEPDSTATPAAVGAGPPPSVRAAVRPPAGRPSGTRQAGPPARTRMGLRQAFRAAFREAHVREDLPYVPGLLVHKAVWIPILFSAAAVVLFSLTGPKNAITSFAFNTFGLPPALAAVFITGFFVPRAAYLMGGIVATVAAVFYCGWVVVAAQGGVPDIPAVGLDKVPGEITSAFSIGPISGVVFGAAAAWYRRFLYLSSPARPANRGGAGPSRKPRATTGRPGAGTRSR